MMILTMREKAIFRVALITAAILALPLIAMQFTDEVDWNLADFAIGGALLFGAGITFELIASRCSDITYRIAVGVAVLASLLLIWAILAVGVVGSAANSQTDEEAIRAARIASNEAIARHDAEAIASFLDSEYQITTSIGQMFQGTEGEVSTWNRLFAERPNVLYVRTPQEVKVSLDYPLASESGTWIGTWDTAEGPVRTGGSYQAMWRKAGGEWKIRAELFVALFCEGDGCPKPIDR